ncbi:SEL1-like repeat protein [Parasphingorhabdus cellanae]|uniref:SEL1-like repeat protein n=1 Tax=Parasphingorhabdus cellanae TaxID=2806553 RepID=A0ABX7T8P6_9SPHN|nr:SEL1-like repeat protein [Parasphingorhabdus cellanae]QTD57491.1 SEL1-like repeat protein [Parasphingorhabdus cellanae]
MYLTRGYSKFWQRLIGGGALLGATIALASCVAPSRYMGIDISQPHPALASPTSYSEMSTISLARKAQGGDKHAQLELGIRFEEGRGVERDLGKAKKLCRLAASDSGGRIWVYSPPVGNGTKGRVIPMDIGPKQFGLAVARVRLEAVK